jgi:HK97 family phage portal protein
MSRYGTQGNAVKSGLRRAFRNQVTSPIPFPSPGRYNIFDLAGGKASNDTFLRAFGSSGTIYSIVTTLATAVAMPEWHLYKKRPVDGRRRYTTGDQGSDQRVEVVNHAALSLWDKPNDFHMRFEFVEGFAQHLELCGEAWWVLGRSNGLGFPTSMWYVRPDRMEPVPSPDNYLQGYIYTGPNGEQVPLEVDEVIMIKFPNPLDPYRGTGPVQTILADIQAQRYTAEWNKNFFQNSATPGGLIQVDKRLSDPEWDELTARWRETHQGVARAGRVGVLENGAQWVDTKITQKDMDFANLRTMSRDVLREAWGIHKSMLGNSDDVNRANAQTAEEVFGSWKVIPRENRIRMALNCKLLPMFGASGAGVEFDYENPLPDDREADNAELTVKATAAQTLINAGFDQGDVLEVVGLPDMEIVEKPTQMPVAPPGWVPAAPAAAPAGAPAAPAGKPPAKPGEAPDTGDEQLNAELVELVRGHWDQQTAGNGHRKAGA